MNRSERRRQADQVAKMFLKNPPTQDAQVPPTVFKMLKKRLSKKGVIKSKKRKAEFVFAGPPEVKENLENDYKKTLE
jgi:hypothetical protein